MSHILLCYWYGYGYGYVCVLFMYVCLNYMRVSACPCQCFVRCIVCVAVLFNRMIIKARVCVVWPMVVYVLS